jgi:membrane protein DedA with SNARE-associated domain
MSNFTQKKKVMGYFFSIFIGTFILEDLALATGIALMSENKIGFQTAFLACFLGISVGDLGLYFIGYFASRWNLLTRMNFLKKYQVGFSKMKHSKTLTYSIVISRILPGTRLPTYLAAGFLKYSFIQFTLLTIASVFVWVLLALVGGKSLIYIFKDRWFLSLVVFLGLLQLIKSLAPLITDQWKRKAFLHSWRRWLHFEFWPASIFYLPIAPYYIFLSLRYKSFFAPFYASPHLKHGGLIGESKWDLLQHLDINDRSTLKTLKVDKTIDIKGARIILENHGFQYPFIIKPDVGQRGFGVRIIRNDVDLTEYLRLSEFEKIIQKLSPLPCEAGVFYIREPSIDRGFIFSITDKKFPFVIGDGKNRLGDLILKDPRARIIAAIYFERHKDQLDSIPQKNEIIPLSECGNHCQGAIFLNGNHLISKKLTEEIDRISKQIPDFYFGRFDIRYNDVESLMQGRHFEIVEINGSGSEATHIWDAQTKITEAYKTLFLQWTFLFKIGDQVRRLPGKFKKVQFLSFLNDCAKVAFRKETLSTSS